MKITRINYCSKIPSFGKKGKGETNKKPSEDNKPNYVLDFFNKPFMSDEEIKKFSKQIKISLTDPILQSRRARHTNPFIERVAQLKRNPARVHDIEKIKSVILTPTQTVKPKSFENSDKKFVLDKYQKEAIEAFISGKNTVVTAPTGTGKTLIAEYGIDDALKNGKRIIYLSPLKALSNEKFVKFSELFGKYDSEGNFLNSDNVGIITGDIVINPNAQLLVMTTEIYRNMINSNDEKSVSEAFKDFSAVIYDEFHYLKDPDRGTVWEESVVQTPKHMHQMMLSATASNAKEMAKWLSSIDPMHDVALVDVPENERYVPLNEYVFGYDISTGYVIVPIFNRQIDLSYLQKPDGDRIKETIEEIENIYDGKTLMQILSPLADQNGIIDADKLARILMLQKNIKKEKAQQIAYILSNPKKANKSSIRLSYAQKNPPVVDIARVLQESEKTPALFFIFSKKRCKRELNEVSRRLGTLLSPEQYVKALKIINEAQEKGIYFGQDFEQEYKPKLLMGYAVHHAGMLPAYKSLVEKLSREGLIKMCFATETLLAGINMPFKTTVFTSLEKFDGRSIIKMSPTTYKQGAGRAGRRGIDDIGNVVVCPTSRYQLIDFEDLMESKDTSISSAFKLTYATLLQTRTMDNLNNFLEKSFYAFQKGSTQKIKREAKKKLNYLKEKGYIEYINESFKRTQKGEMAKDVYGINQILFCELINNPIYTKDLNPQELAALMVMFADIKDDKPREIFDDDLIEVATKLSPAIDLAKQISKEQNKRQIYEEIKISTNLVGAVLEFANTVCDDKKEYHDVWGEIFNNLKTKRIIAHEGDLLRVFNGTIDLLRTITEVSNDPALVHKAYLAINCLKKPPITDILEYELNIK